MAMVSTPLSTGSVQVPLLEEAHITLQVGVASAVHLAHAAAPMRATIS
jgi:hypothetical protein